MRDSFNGSCNEENSHLYPSVTIPGQSESIYEMLTRFQYTGMMPKGLPSYYDEGIDLTEQSGYDMADAKLAEIAIQQKYLQQKQREYEAFKQSQSGVSTERSEDTNPAKDVKPKAQ